MRLNPPQMMGYASPQGLRDYLFELVGNLNVMIDQLDAGAISTEKAGPDSQIAVARGNLSMSGNRITDLAQPQGPHDAVTLEYMQQYIAGRK